MICLSRRRVAIAFGVLLAIPLVLLLTAPWWLRGIGNWLAVDPQSGAADAIVILSGGTKRILHGFDLYQAGRAPALWYVGNDPLADVPGFAEGDFFRGVAAAEGVPLDVIRQLPSTSTLEDAAAIAAEVEQEQIDELLIVTDWYHSRRALCVLRREMDGSGITIRYAPAETPFGPGDWWHDEEGLVSVTNELLKFGFYWRQYGLAPWSC